MTRNESPNRVIRVQRAAARPRARKAEPSIDTAAGGRLRNDVERMETRMRHARRRSPDGAAACSLCPPGQYSSAGAGACSPCPAGKYASEAGNASCADCPANTISGVKAASCTACPANSTANASHTACQCNVGFYVPSDSTLCVACLPGAVCTGGDIVIDPSTGFWTPSGQP